MHDPLFDHRPPSRIRAQCAAIGVAGGGAALLSMLAERHGLDRLRDDCVGVKGVHRAVTIAVEDDRRHNALPRAGPRGIGVEISGLSAVRVQ